MASNWFYYRGEELVGPVTSQELRRLARGGEMSADTKVRKGEAGALVPASSIRGLFDAAGGRPAVDRGRDASEPAASSESGGRGTTVLWWGMIAVCIIFGVGFGTFIALNDFGLKDHLTGEAGDAAAKDSSADGGVDGDSSDAVALVEQILALDEQISELRTEQASIVGAVTTISRDLKLETISDEGSEFVLDDRAQWQEVTDDHGAVWEVNGHSGALTVTVEDGKTLIESRTKATAGARDPHLQLRNRAGDTERHFTSVTLYDKNDRHGENKLLLYTLVDGFEAEVSRTALRDIETGTTIDFPADPPIHAFSFLLYGTSSSVQIGDIRYECTGPSEDDGSGAELETRIATLQEDRSQLVDRLTTSIDESGEAGVREMIADEAKSGDLAGAGEIAALFEDVPEGKAESLKDLRREIVRTNDAAAIVAAVEEMDAAAAKAAQGRPDDETAVAAADPARATPRNERPARVNLPQVASEGIVTIVGDPGFNSGSSFQDIEFSPDGRRIYTTADFNLDVWDAATGARLQMLRQPKFDSLELYPPYNVASMDHIAVSSDGKLIVAGDQILSVFDGESGDYLYTIALPAFLDGLEFRPGTHELAVGTANKTIRLWDADRRRWLGDFIHTARANLSFDRSGKRLAAWCRDDSLRVFDVEKRTYLANFKESSGKSIEAAKITPDGKSFVAITKPKDVDAWFLQTMDAEDGAVQQIVRLEGYSGSGELYFSPKRPDEVIVARKTWARHRLSDLTVIAEHELHRWSNRAAVDPTGKRIAHGWTTIEFLDAETLKPDKSTRMDAEIQKMAIPQQSDRFYTAHADGIIQCRSLDGEVLFRSQMHEADQFSISELFISRDGKTGVSFNQPVVATKSSELVRWDAATGRILNRLIVPDSGYLRVSPDCRTFARIDKNDRTRLTVEAFSTDGVEVVFRVEGDRRLDPMFSSAGKYVRVQDILFAERTNEGPYEIRRADDGSVVQRFEFDHEYPYIYFCEDEEYVLTRDGPYGDRTVRLIRLEDGEVVKTWNCDAMDLSRDGRSVVLTDGDQRSVWSVPDGTRKGTIDKDWYPVELPQFGLVRSNYRNRYSWFSLSLFDGGTFGLQEPMHSSDTQFAQDRPLAFLRSGSAVVVIDLQKMIESGSTPPAASDPRLVDALDTGYPSKRILSKDEIWERVDLVLPPEVDRNTFGGTSTFHYICLFESLLATVGEHLAEDEYVALVRAQIRVTHSPGGAQEHVPLRTNSYDFLSDEQIESELNESYGKYVDEMNDVMSDKYQRVLRDLKVTTIEVAKAWGDDPYAQPLILLNDYRRLGPGRIFDLDDLAAQPPLTEEQFEVVIQNDNSGERVSLLQLGGAIKDPESFFGLGSGSSSSGSDIGEDSSSSTSGNSARSARYTVTVTLVQPNGQPWSNHDFQYVDGALGSFESAETDGNGSAAIGISSHQLEIWANGRKRADYFIDRDREYTITVP